MNDISDFDAPLSDYPTDDILHDYKMLIEDFGPDDELIAEMREILVSRHRYLTGDEAGDVGQNWQGAHCDTAKYHISASLIFEVDRALYDFYGTLDGTLRQQVPIGKSTIDSSTAWRYLIGLQISCEDMMMYHIDESVALKIIDVLLARAVPNGTA